MKEKFEEHRFSPEALAIARRADAIAADYARRGFDLTLRQLYYQFVAGNLFPADRTYVNENGKWVRDPAGSINAEPNYKWLGDIVTNARLCGMMDWDHITDRARTTKRRETWSDLSDFLTDMRGRYARERWTHQPRHIEVMVEKQALEGVLSAVCEKWHVSLTSNKGYASASLYYERGKYLQSMRDVEGREPHIIYLGDHDPSGLDMSRDLQRRISLFSDGPVVFHRVALNIDQVRAHNLVENPTKPKDSRTSGYVERFGEHCWELDALAPETLVALVEGKISSLVDQKRWAADGDVELDDQERIQDIVDSLVRKRK